MPNFQVSLYPAGTTVEMDSARILRGCCCAPVIKSATWDYSNGDGSPYPGAYLTLKGKHFRHNYQPTPVTGYRRTIGFVNGVLCAIAYTSVSDAQNMVTLVPNYQCDPSGGVRVKVQNPDGQFSNNLFLHGCSPPSTGGGAGFPNSFTISGPGSVQLGVYYNYTIQTDPGYTGPVAITSPYPDGVSQCYVFGGASWSGLTQVRVNNQVIQYLSSGTTTNVGYVIVNITNGRGSFNMDHQAGVNPNYAANGGAQGSWYMIAANPSTHQRVYTNGSNTIGVYGSYL
jgi:hypothetical protein